MLSVKGIMVCLVAVIKPINLLTTPSVKNQKKVKSCTSEYRVNFLSMVLCLHETQVWEIENYNFFFFKQKYLLSLFNSKARKRQSCVICSLWVLIYDWPFDGKLSGGLLLLTLSTLIYWKEKDAIAVATFSI